MAQPSYRPTANMTSLVALKGDPRNFLEQGHPPPPHYDGHSHTHGTIDPEIASSERGIWTIAWSLVG